MVERSLILDLISDTNNRRDYRVILVRIDFLSQPANRLPHRIEAGIFA